MPAGCPDPDVGLGPVGRLSLVQDPGCVILHCYQAEAESPGDLLIAGPIGTQVEARPGPAQSRHHGD